LNGDKNQSLPPVILIHGFFKAKIDQIISSQQAHIVSFADNNNIRRHGVITKRNQKTFQITTPEHYSINVPATYLRHEPKLVKFKKGLLITNED
jgi:hypothetical protein